MASSREIKRRIRSVKNVAQITRAMEMVSASKMRRAQRNVLATRPYADRLMDVISELSLRINSGARRNTLLEPRAVINNVALVVITPDRGLCGSLVANVLRRSGRFILDQQKQNRGVETYAIGKRGRDFMARTQQHLVGEITKLGDAPKLEDTLGIASNVVSGFRGQQYDEVYMVYSEFVNTLVQRPALRRLIPIEPPTDATSTRRFDYTYEPDQQDVLYELLPRYIEVQIYQAILEGIASEHSARMVAMRNATNNAKDLVRDLTLTYNKTRQASITNEVNEIASGAAALEG